MPQMRESTRPCRNPFREKAQEMLNRRMGQRRQKGNRMRLCRVDQRDDGKIGGSLSGLRQRSRAFHYKRGQEDEKVFNRRLGQGYTPGNGMYICRMAEIGSE